MLAVADYVSRQRIAQGPPRSHVDLHVGDSDRGAGKAHEVLHMRDVLDALIRAYEIQVRAPALLWAGLFFVRDAPLRRDASRSRTASTALGSTTSSS